MSQLLTFASLLLLLACFHFSNVNASGCIAMDSNFNLYVFDLNKEDWSVGSQSNWAQSSSATVITAPGRPPFDTPNPSCYLAQFYNASYFLNVDSKNPSDVYILDYADMTWSTQSVVTPKNAGGDSLDPTISVSILDHDTNVIYALSGEEMWYLNMEAMVTANESAITYVDVGQVPFDTSNYSPVMALAQNHIHFLDLSILASGQLEIYVIHYDWFQPTPQSYPSANGSLFPEQHGKTASFFMPASVQEQFAFIPDDGSATYIINVETNSTQILSGPTTKDPNATYFAGLDTLVQLSSSGNVMYMPVSPNDTNANAQAGWTRVTAVPAPNSTLTSNSTNSTGSGVGAQTAAGSSPSTTSSPNGDIGYQSPLYAAVLIGILAALSLI